MNTRGWLMVSSLAFAALSGRASETVAAPLTAVVDTVTKPDPDRYIEVLVELRFGRLLARTIAAYQVDDVALLPLADFLRMADYSFTREGDSVITATLQPQDVEVRFALGATTVQVGDRTVPFRRDDLILRDGAMYMATGPLGRILRVNFLVGWRDLYVAIENPAPLPVAQSIQRAARRRALTRSQTAYRPELALSAPRTGLDGFVVNYSAVVPSTEPTRNGSFSLGVGANVLGGSFELTSRTVGAGDNRSAEFRGSWTGFWPDDPMLKQVRVGDGVSTGPRPRSIRGLSISNVPFWRPPNFGFADYRGSLAPGWEIEAYRNGRLIAYDSVSAAGDFSFSLPVERGQNAVDFIAYGPFGEIRRFNRTYQIGQTILPKRAFEYGVSAGACTTNRCLGTINADFRYGLTKRITVGGGYDRYWRNQGEDLDHPYASIGGSPINALTLELGGVLNGFARAAVRVEPSINARVMVEHLDYDEGITDPIVSPINTRSRTSVNAFYRPVRWTRSLFFEAQADRLEQVQGRTSRGRLAMSAFLNNVTVSPFVRLQRDERSGISSTRTFGGLQVMALPQRQLGRVLGSLTFRAGIQFEDMSRVSQADVFVFKSFHTGLRLEAGAAWTDAFPGVSYRFGITSTVGGVYAGLRSLVSSTGSSETFAQLQGSAAWNPETKSFSLSPVGSLQQSGITGTVFLDHNANGVRDPGEPGIPDARVIIGYTTIRSDEAGRYQAWEASPFTAAIVTIDSLSLANPLWVPLYRSISVSPGPNSYMAVDLPVVESAIIEGRVTSPEGTGKVRVGHIPLLLINRVTGEETRLTTFSDGEFYQMGVRPGEYDLRVDETLQSGVVSVGTAVRFSVQPLPGGTTIDGLVLEIQADQESLP